MANIYKYYTQKTKNKRVTLAYNDDINKFLLVFKRLKEKDEIINEVSGIETTVDVKVVRNRLVITTVKITGEAAYMLILNFNRFIKDCNEGMFLNYKAK